MLVQNHGVLQGIVYRIVLRKVKMAKRLVFCVALLITLLSISGCPSVVSKSPEPPVDEVFESETSVSEPNNIVPVEIKPDGAEPDNLEIVSAKLFHDKFAGILKDLSLIHI